MRESSPGGRSLFIDDYNLVPRLNGNGAVRREVGLVMMHGVLCSAADIHDEVREMTLSAYRVLPVILVTAAVFALCVCQGTQKNCCVNYADCHRSGAHNDGPVSYLSKIGNFCSTFFDNF